MVSLLSLFCIFSFGFPNVFSTLIEIEGESDLDSNLFGVDDVYGSSGSSGEPPAPEIIEEMCANAPLHKYYDAAINDGMWSEWSPCSRSCCVGVRCRRCIKPPCSGHSTELCNTNMCQKSCPEPQHCRQRQEFLSMENHQKQRFINAFRAISTQHGFKNRFNALAKIHFENFKGERIHKKHEFLPWHRWYLLMLENLLRCYDCGATLPYWDWSLEADHWERSEVWQWIGGDGNWFDNDYVRTGPFGKYFWSHTLLPQTWLRRYFYPITVTNAQVIGYALSRFTPEMFMVPGGGYKTSFEEWLRGQVHNIGHFVVGGTMMTLFSSGIPDFYLHHGFIDKIWDDWQKRSDLHKRSYFANITTTMATTEVSPRDVYDLEDQPGGVKVCYLNPHGLKGIVVDLTRSLSAEALRSVPAATAPTAPREVWDLFKVAEEERHRVTLSNERNQPSRTQVALLMKDQQQCRYIKEKTMEQEEFCKEQEQMGLSIRVLFKAGVKEGKISSSEMKRIELVRERVAPSWFKVPARLPSGNSVEIEEESE